MSDPPLSRWQPMKQKQSNGQVLIVSNPSRNSGIKGVRHFYPRNTSAFVSGTGIALDWIYYDPYGNTWLYEYSWDDVLSRDLAYDAWVDLDGTSSGGQTGGVYFNSGIRSSRPVTKTLL